MSEIKRISMDDWLAAADDLIEEIKEARVPSEALADACEAGVQMGMAEAPFAIAYDEMSEDDMERAFLAMTDGDERDEVSKMTLSISEPIPIGDSDDL